MPGFSAKLRAILLKWSAARRMLLSCQRVTIFQRSCQERSFSAVGRVALPVTLRKVSWIEVEYRRQKASALEDVDSGTLC